MLDWNAPLQNREGLRGTLETPCPIHGTRRVMFDGIGKDGTVFRYDEKGRCRGDGADSPMDLLNVPESLAASA